MLNDTTKIEQSYYDKLLRIEKAFDTLCEQLYGEGPYTMTVDFEIEADDIWIEASITPRGDPHDDLGIFVGETESFTEAIASMIETMDQREVESA